MSAVVTAFVLLGLVLVAGAAVLFGMDVFAAVILALIAGLGWLAVAAARRSEMGRFGPATCSECEGLISPNSPYCKHCGELRTPGREPTGDEGSIRGR